MTITQERITPDKAREYLGMNVDNYRKLNSARVQTYCADMKAGRWQFNGESIKFSQNGVLMDGQHRLQAIVKADVPVDMLVIRGLDNDVDICDIGSVRTLGMIAKRRGTCEANATTIVALANFIIGNGDPHKTSGNGAILDYIGEHEEELKKAHTATMCGSKPICRKAPIMAAVYCLIRNGEDLSDIQNFFKIANSGLPTGHYELSPALIFRNTIMEYTLRNVEERRMMFCITVQAIKDFLAGKVRTTKYRASVDGLKLMHKIRVEDGIEQ